MRQERQVVARAGPDRRACHCLIAFADILCDGASLLNGLFELPVDILTGQGRMWAVVTVDPERVQPLLCRAHVIGDHRNGIIELHDLAHGLDLLGGAVVQMFDTAAGNERLRQRHDLQRRWPGVDAVDCGLVDLARQVERLALGGCADQLELVRRLERNGRRRRQARCVAGQWPISEALAARMNNPAGLGAAGYGVDTPAPGRRPRST